MGLPCQAADAKGPYLVISSRKLDENRASISNYGVTRDDFRQIQELPSVRAATAIRALRTDVHFRDRKADPVVLGVTPTVLNVLRDRNGVKISRGRYLTTADLSARNNVAVLADHVARGLFYDSDPLGHNIKIRGHYFLVVGTFQHDMTDLGKGLPGGVHLPLTTMRARFGDIFVSRSGGQFESTRFELSQVWLEVTTPSALATTRRLVEHILTLNHEEPDYEINMIR
jgi:putative ABC transport system permease protein